MSLVRRPVRPRRSDRADRADRAAVRRTGPASAIALALAAGLGVAGLLAAGCAPAATYPQVEGSVAIASPRLAPIPRLMAEAIEEHRGDVGVPADADAAGGGDAPSVVPFNLPEGTPLAVWREVERRVPGARPATADDIAIVHVRQVRIRPGDAEVDVVVEPLPGRPNDVPYLATVTLEQPAFRGWGVVRTRAWRVPTEVPALAWRDPAAESADEAAAEAVARPEPAVEPVEPPAGAEEAPDADADGNGDGGERAAVGEPPVLRGASG